MSGPTPSTQRSRLMIVQMKLENFKSYAGERVLGPFHKCFTSVVGPNGSGKSNVIDALLFVFGNKAKRLRQRKISNLIHKSDKFPDLTYCRVSVYFQDIIDDEEGDEFKVVEGSRFVVTREATKKNTSKYYINKKSSTFTEVQQLLRGRGVDLDHKRFLILQGEVEQISLMKPKGSKEGEVGILEYLEDLIGTSALVEHINASEEEIESLTEERMEKLNQVKAAEREKDNLEGPMKEALAYRKKEIEQLELQSKLYQKKRYDEESRVRELLPEKEEAERVAKDLNERMDTVRKEKEAAEKELKRGLKECQSMASDLAEAKERYVSFERSEIKLKQTVEHSSEAEKKHAKALENHQTKVEEMEAAIEEKQELLSQLEAEQDDLKLACDEAAAALEALYEGLKGETAELHSQMADARAEMGPATAALQSAQADLELAQSQLDIIQRRNTQAQEDLDAATEQLKEMRAQKKEALQECKHWASQVEDLEEEAARVEETVRGWEEERERMERELALARRDAEEVRQTLHQRQGRSKALSCLQGAPSGTFTGDIFGRLGDLGAVDGEVGVAASVAAGAALNHIVVDRTATAQQCIQYLRDHRGGVASFIVLKKIAHPSMLRRMAPGKFPLPRLFDLVRVDDEKFRVAFYFALRDTLVAESLEEASRIAYANPKRPHRVVTRMGELIDKSGTMSGGAASKSGGPVSILIAGSSSSSTKGGMTLKRMEGDARSAKARVKEAEEAVAAAQLEEERGTEEAERLARGIREAKAALSKATRETESLEGAIGALEARMEGLRDAISGGVSTKEKAAERAAAKEVERAEAAFERAQEAASEGQRVLDALQERLDAVGGPEVSRARAKANDAEAKQTEAIERATRLRVEIKGCKGTACKARKAAKKADKELRQAAKAAAKAHKALVKLQEEAGDVMEAYDALQEQHAQAEQVVSVAKAEADGAKAAVLELTPEVADAENALAEITRTFEALRVGTKEYETRLEQIRRKHAKLYRDVAHLEESAAPNQDPQEVSTPGDGEEQSGATATSDEDVGVDDEDEEGGEQEEACAMDGVLPHYSEEVLEDVDVRHVGKQVKRVAQELEALSGTCNMAAIAEYASKQREWSVRVSQLEDASARRDVARATYETLRKERLERFMSGFTIITMKLKEMYRMITRGGDAELELVDSLDPFSEGINFSVRPPKKSWKNITNLSGGEKTLSSLALVFALHHYKPTPLYVMDEIDAALDFKNVSIIAHYIKERTKNAQFVIISLRNNMFELADRLVGIYKTEDCTKSVAITPNAFSMRPAPPTVTATTKSSPHIAVDGASKENDGENEAEDQ